MDLSSQIPLYLPNLVTQPFSQTLHRNRSNPNLHAWLLEPQQSRSRASLRQWQRELMLLKEDQPDLSMSHSGPFLQSGVSVIRWTSGHHLLLYLFQDRKLQPGTIDGYRSAIADKLGNFPINVSKDDNVTCLLGSSHRDRPKGMRGIPSWNLSLVLHQLTKAPFEPLKEASLKHLIFKTVFLLALASGKCRSEIHAWLHKNIRHQSDWSKVSLYPSPSFLSKNQLAKMGPNNVSPVVLPALAPTLDKSLKGDRSLCPVRSMLGYTRTSDTSQTGLRCRCTPHPAFCPRTNWLRGVQIVCPRWFYQRWPPLLISHLKVTGPYAQSEPCVIIWTGPQILGRTKS